MGRTLVLIGVAFVIIGLLWQFGERFGLGKLPGDLTIQGENYSIHFPVVTCILISVLLTALGWMWRYLQK
jgi:hypothetical protein